MNGAAIDLFGAAFLARHSRGCNDDRARLIEPGACGVVIGPDDQTVRLLVTDDRAHGRLTAVVPNAREGSVTVLDSASRCSDFMDGRRGWTAERSVTAMVLRDIHTVPPVALPEGLSLRPVTDAVSLRAAAAVAIASDPDIADPLEEFAAFLGALSPSTQLFALVDEHGVARATSGYDVCGEYARIFFVNTEPGWRRRGIGRAMTVAALRAAAGSGARRAVLTATDSGASVYSRLGFEAAGRVTRYVRRAV